MPSIRFLTVAHSFTPVQSRIQDKRYRCLILESTQQVEQDSNMTEDDWRHANFQKDEELECFSTRVQLRNQFCLLAVSLSRGAQVMAQSLRHLTVDSVRRATGLWECRKCIGCFHSWRTVCKSSDHTSVGVFLSLRGKMREAGVTSCM